MPKTLIRTNVGDPHARAKVAQAITDVFSDVGVADLHISTLFIPTDGTDLYVAGRTYDEAAGEAGFALVEVMTSASRPEAFRQAMASAVTAAFDGHAVRTRVSIDFVAREGVDVYIGGRAMANAGPAQVTDTPPIAPMPILSPSPAPSPSGEQVAGAVGVTETDIRQALVDLVWSPEAIDAPASTSLDDLHPDRALRSWDSLAGVEAVEGVLELLGFPADRADPGTKEFEVAVSGSPMLGDLVSYLLWLTAA